MSSTAYCYFSHLDTDDNTAVTATTTVFSVAVVLLVVGVATHKLYYKKTRGDGEDSSGVLGTA